MAAELHIHVMTEQITEGDLALFFSHTRGSKYFNLRKQHDGTVYSRIAATPSCCVGEVSWLKAIVFGDPEAFVPDVVQSVVDIIGEELPTIDDALIGKIAGAFEAPNTTGYAVDDGVRVTTFLREHIGHAVFTVSW